jgi:hypothetical protein
MAVRTGARTGTLPGCRHLRREIRVVPGVSKKLMFGRCMLKRDSEVREEIARAASLLNADTLDTRDCGFFESGSWKSCPRYVPAGR